VRETRNTRPEYLELVRQDARRVRFLELALATYQVLTDDIRARLRSIRAPTLVVWGGRDVLTPPHLGRQLAAEIPGAELQVIESAGHNPMWDEPERFCELVGDFLNAGSAGPDERRPALMLGA
jgi:pimeloyl-ACP methyl ester carboxylesterase